MYWYYLEAVQELPIGTDEAWQFLTNAKNLEFLTPEPMNLTIKSSNTTPLYTGKILHYSVTPLPLYKTLWVSEITSYIEGKLFADKQLYGPYKSWNHEHEVTESQAGSSIIDRVYFQMPFGILGGLAFTLIVRRALLKAFSFRKSQLIKLYPAAENLHYSFQLKRIKA